MVVCYLNNGVNSAHYILTGLKLNVAAPDKLKLLSTIRDFVRWGTSEFTRRELNFGHGFETALDEARYLTLHALDLPLDLPDTYLECVVTREEREHIIDILGQRLELRKPAAYICRESWFCGLKFYVDERVLVPRSPMAELIAAQFEPWVNPSEIHRILDLCTGSACIAIASQYQFEDAAVFASDISADALEVAEINCREHSLESYITLYQSDLFNDIPAQTFDLIVCNPPYVDAEEMNQLSAEFQCEPGVGLAAGEDGLALVNRILMKVGDYLSNNGVIFIEVGNSQEAMMERYAFLPMTWIDFEFGGSGVCCIQAEDLRQQRDNVERINNGQRVVSHA